MAVENKILFAGDVIHVTCPNGATLEIECTQDTVSVTDHTGQVFYTEAKDQGKWIREWPRERVQAKDDLIRKIASAFEDGTLAINDDAVAALKKRIGL